MSAPALSRHSPPTPPAPAGFPHGRVAVRLGARIDRHVEETGSGVVVAAETGFRIAHDPDTVRAPDAAFVAAGRMPPESERRGFLDLAPDVVVEVVSPSDRAGDVLPGLRIAVDDLFS